MAAFPHIWTLCLWGLFLSIWPRCCLNASLLLFSAELYSTCSSSHGFHSSARNGATPPSLTPPANTAHHLHSANRHGFSVTTIKYRLLIVNVWFYFTQRICSRGYLTVVWNYPSSLFSPLCERGKLLWCWRRHCMQRRVKMPHTQK